MVDVIVDEVKRVGFYVKIYEYIVLSIMKQRTTHMVVSLAWKMLWLRGPGGVGKHVGCCLRGDKHRDEQIILRGDKHRS